MEIRDKIKHFFSFDRRLDCSGAPHSSAGAVVNFIVGHQA